SMEAVGGTDPCRGITEQWVRPDSALAVLFVSDEDNCSKSGVGTDCFGEEYRNPSYLTDYLASIRKIGVNARVYGLIYQPGTMCADADNQGIAYDAAIKVTNGASGSICDADYTETLETISKDISVILESKFKLRNDADPTSLEVFVDGEAAAIEYKVFGNVVSFTNPPPPGSTVTIKYRPKSVEGKNRFPLSRIFEGRIMVEIDGEMLDATQFTVDKDTNEVVFRSAPPKNAEIRIYYGEEAVIRDSFSLEPGINTATLRIYIDDVEVTEFEFDNSDGLITFDVIPPENSKILATYAR
ncbi:hypothetical protein N9D31_04250, partial [Oligoflexaceae bacterium]|nr:hypothetical protein [Oligoflexaceae bacterium]